MVQVRTRRGARRIPRTPAVRGGDDPAGDAMTRSSSGCHGHGSGNPHIRAAVRPLNCCPSRRRGSRQRTRCSNVTGACAARTPWNGRARSVAFRRPRPTPARSASRTVNALPSVAGRSVWCPMSQSSAPQQHPIPRDPGHCAESASQPHVWRPKPWRPRECKRASESIDFDALLHSQSARTRAGRGARQGAKRSRVCRAPGAASRGSSA